MILSRAAFWQAFQDDTLHISLIGMSNIGKSWLADRLSPPFTHVEVDTYIQSRLDLGDMSDFAAWLGRPDSQGYATREAHSLDLEHRATLDALDAISGNTILDTTGSVIYTDARNQVKSTTYTVYLKATAVQIDVLHDLYFSLPKPLNWSGNFKAEPGEDFETAARRCYPALLSSRDTLYAKLADYTVLAEDIFVDKLGTDGLITLLQPPVE